MVFAKTLFASKDHLQLAFVSQKYNCYNMNQNLDNSERQQDLINDVQTLDEYVNLGGFIFKHIK